MSHDEMALMLRYFKAMADESRLRLMGVLASRECSVEELAELLTLKGPTVSHHLAKLRELGLVRMRAEGNTHLYALEVTKLHELGKTLFAAEAIASLADDVNGEAWERKILEDFFVG
ncbi:MAG: transcriptional regulator, ArsR family, partial [Cyanobacteria bacterium RYN_339]|nr:transcriptional regulator, ArsR family [Cyanobacteria bacterium RYN_339]